MLVWSRNVLAFPPVQKNGQSIGSIRVAVNGAAGIEAADFQISIESPERRPRVQRFPHTA